MIALVLTGRVVVLTGWAAWVVLALFLWLDLLLCLLFIRITLPPVQRALDWSLERRRQAILRRDDE